MAPTVCESCLYLAISFVYEGRACSHGRETGGGRSLVPLSLRGATGFSREDAARRMPPLFIKRFGNGMNMHLSPQDPEVRARLEYDSSEAHEEARAKRLKMRLIVLASVLAVAAFVAFLVWKANAPKPSAPPT